MDLLQIKLREKQRTANMQYKKLGFCGLVRGFGSHQVWCMVRGNRSEDPQLFILPHVGRYFKKNETQMDYSD